ncbi:MAG: efflux RND transporter periplasmic adaptor subunit [Gammaproteobacteria bacterium]|nr:efflux RND transporter periplasmic adaptor subunit [Sideroxydans sp.]MBU4046707.1 efflux RND transporter periplasmic adaptor subunit [Gammaproteobacteria bacterium]MBU4150704.1 efflux RND transporter periplasmic adaptor subunit [Gammaproteobacteria bacterium]
MTRNNSQIFTGTTLSSLTLALLLLLSGCGGGEQPKKPVAGSAPPPPEVGVIIVKSAPVTLTNELPGRLHAYRTAQVRARVEGVVEKRMFEEGSDVKAGQPLYQIDVGNYRSNYEAAQTDLSLAKQNLERAKQLLEAKVVSQQEYDQTEARFKQAEAAYSKAREDWDNTRVPAPISGRIGLSMVTEGALVGRGEATLLATIEQTDKLYVNFSQTESDIMRLQKAVKSGALKRSASTSIELVLEDDSIYPLPGKLLFTNMAADPSTGSVTMRAEIPNPEHELLPGMFVTIRFPEALAENAIRVPQSAVMMSTQGQFVMVVDAENKVGPRPVKVGNMAGTDFVISSGLQGGEQVIVNGLQKARPGSVVKPVPLQTVADAAPVPAEKK